MTSQILLTTNSSVESSENSFTFDINLEGVGIFLGILISLSILGNFVIKLIINSTIKHEINNLIEEHEERYHRDLSARVGKLETRVFEIRSRLGEDVDSSIL